MGRRTSSVLALAMSTAVVACGGGDGDTPEECNPLGTAGCVLPWPSAMYMRADAASPTGFYLDFPLGALPANVDAIEIDPTWINKRTGFSPMTQILLTFPGGVDSTNLVFWDDIAASTTDASPTVLVDMSTGERVPHFAEVDVNETIELDHQVLYVRPAARLRGNTRYAVGIRTSLRGLGGGALPIAPAFAKLVAGERTGHARLDAIADRFPELFAALEAAGVPRTDLVVAWDFVTADDAATIAEPLAARDAVMAAVGDAEGVAYTITEDTADPEPGIARRVLLDYDVPKIADGSGFSRGADGLPAVAGTVTEPASIIIPSCATPANKARIVIYGHGFFGDLSESTGGYIRQFAQDTCSVVIGGLWRGMSTAEVTDAILGLNDLNRIRGFGEHIWQGMVDFMTLAKFARGKLAREQLVDDPTAANPRSIVDTTQVFYYGISQGAILGATLYAYDPTFQRGAFGVGGANWAVMFERSNNWVVYGAPLKGAYDGLMNSIILQQVLEMGLEIVDGGTVAPWLLTGGLPGTPAKQFLLHMGMGDCQVPNLASEFQARSIGLPVLAPSVKVPFGMTGMDGPVPNAFVIMDEHPDPLPPETNLLFGEDNVAHENLRRRAATIQQIEHFYDTGEVVNFCRSGSGAEPAPCDCAAGNCGPLP